MTQSFRYILCPDWPSLAWLATCRRARDEITVCHGGSVETHAEFFCEAAWDGKFGDGEFDLTDIVIGSGARLRERNVVFVSAGNAVDRLHVLRRSDETWVSNSLVCLLALADGRCDPFYRRYYQFFRSVIDGIERYERFLPASAGNIELVYFRNLAWNGSELARIDKPGLGRDFGDFSRFYAFLHECMARLMENINSNERRLRYALIAALSSGYDSSTVVALASQFSLRKVISFDKAFHGDSGERLAQALALDFVRLGTRDWRALELPEIPFAAANAIGEEARFAAAEPFLKQSVLFTGHPGDRFWGKVPYRPVDAQLSRADTAGVSLTEYRLWVGFLHCAVPFWGGRQLSDIVKISNSQEMRPWDTQGTYTRPICRRIVESRGVPRDAFGVKKRAGSPSLHTIPEFLTEKSLASYTQWLSNLRAREGRRDMRLLIDSPALDRAWFLANWALARGLEGKPLLWRLAHKFFARGPTPFRRFVFPWAMEMAVNRYSKPPL